MKLSTKAKSMLTSTYIKNGESIESRFASIAKVYGSNKEHAKRILHYLHSGWLIPATPVIANTTKEMADAITTYLDYSTVIDTIKALPISCYLQYIPDTLSGIIESQSEAKYLSTSGGGIGSYWGAVRAASDKSPGIMPLLASEDSTVLAFYQGKTRRGANCAYIDYNNKDIKQFIVGRDIVSGDVSQKFPNLHHGICITDEFINAVREGTTIELFDRGIGTGEFISARELWYSILVQRHRTGEPFICNISAMNAALPQSQKDLGLTVHASNLCTEITLPTNEERTAVCCIANLNVALFDEWQCDELFVGDVVEFCDNILSLFIACTDNKEQFRKANFSAKRERAMSIGAPGFHSYLQEHNIPYESALAVSFNKRLFKHIKTLAVKRSKELAIELGEPEDMKSTGLRNSHLLGIAPNVSTSQILGVSPSVEPLRANVFLQKNNSGNDVVKNRYLRKVLQKYDIDNKATWDSILSHKGSVQHLTALTEWERDVFKTAIEIDQNWIVQHALDRQEYICQAQSVNLFYPATVTIAELNAAHWRAVAGGLKTLYYLRSESVLEADSSVKVSKVIKQDFITNECLACQ